MFCFTLSVMLMNIAMMEKDKCEFRFASFLHDFKSDILRTRRWLRFFNKYHYLDRRGHRVWNVYTQVIKLINRFNIEVKTVPHHDSFISVDPKECAYKIYDQILSNFDVGKRIVCFYCHFGKAKAEYRNLKQSVRKLKHAKRIFVTIMREIGINDIKSEGTCLNLPQFEPMREKSYKKNIDTNEMQKLAESTAKPLAVSLGMRMMHSLVLANQLNKRAKVNLSERSKCIAKQAKRIAKNFTRARGQLYSMFPTCSSSFSKFETPSFLDIVSTLCSLQNEIGASIEFCNQLRQESLFACDGIVLSKISRIKSILRSSLRQVKTLIQSE